MPGVKGLKIGEKIRGLRRSKNVDIGDLAQQVGISAAVLGQIESDVVPPTIATLMKIATILGTSMTHFFQEEEEAHEIEVVRRGERQKMRKPSGAGQSSLSYAYEALASTHVASHMQPLLVEFNLDVADDLVPVSHEGEEFHYVLEGTVEFQGGGQVVTLRPGDSLYFKATVPHVLRGTGSVPPKTISVVYVPDDEQAKSSE